MIHSHHWYMIRFPAFNKACVECGEEFNALYVKPRTRLTCSKECSTKHTIKVQRANTAAYVRTPEYKARNRIRNREYRQSKMVMVPGDNLK